MLHGDALSVLRTLPTGSAQCCVTSPPYWGLRDYGVEGQIGLEPRLDDYLDRLVATFHEVHRVLRADGTLWLNVGDSYASGGAGARDRTPDPRPDARGIPAAGTRRPTWRAYDPKPKDLVMLPARVALALQADGWYLRSDIVWHKPNCMPESVRDRPTRCHEYVFLLSKSARYYYDRHAIIEPYRYGRDHQRHVDSPPASHVPGATAHSGLRRSGNRHRVGGGAIGRPRDGPGRGVPWTESDGRNARSVWTITVQPYPGAHFATMPLELARRCVAAGAAPYACGRCGMPYARRTEREIVGPVWHQRGPRTGGHPRGDLLRGRGKFPVRYRVVHHTRRWDAGCACPGERVPGRSLVLDPFAGTGTTGVAALERGCDFVGIDLNPDYVTMARERLDRHVTGSLR